MVKKIKKKKKKININILQPKEITDVKKFLNLAKGDEKAEKGKETKRSK